MCERDLIEEDQKFLDYFGKAEKHSVEPVILTKEVIQQGIAKIEGWPLYPPRPKLINCRIDEAGWFEEQLQEEMKAHMGMDPASLTGGESTGIARMIQTNEGIKLEDLTLIRDNVIRKPLSD